MPPWLLIWIARWASGERFRKATPAERGFFSAYFMLVPPLGAAFVLFGRKFLDNAPVALVTIWVISFSLVMFFVPYLWGKFVPEKISWTLGAVIWAAILFMALTGRLT
jgi:hypothetical protein